MAERKQQMPKKPDAFNEDTTNIPTVRATYDTVSIDAIGDETRIIDPSEEEIVFDADGNIPCDEPPGWRAPTTEQEMAAYLV
jgi:hypothetical protein